jgi:nicotinate-nucleotide adenylyltransferase
LKTGIFGGTFNPVHNGHLIASTFIKEEFGLDEIIFIPDKYPVHKSLDFEVSAEIRLKMLELAINQRQGFKISQIEIDRSGPSYTIVTLNELKKEFPGTEFFLIVGVDSYYDMIDWKNSLELISENKIIVMKRSDSRPDKNLYNYAKGIYFANNPIIEISSSVIRERVIKNLPFDIMVPPAVYDFIKKTRLYSN